MSCDRGGLRFVFDELNRKNKPCLNLDKASDLFLLKGALEFSNENCITMDGCCSSRVFTSLEALKNPVSILTSDSFGTVSDKQAAFSELLEVLCPEGISRCSCDADNNA